MTGTTISGHLILSFEQEASTYRMFVSFLVFVTLFEILFAAEPPRRDGGELLLSKNFLDTCSSRYGVCQENQGQSFVSKYFNVIDPLRINNNLGRSVSKGSYIS